LNKTCLRTAMLASSALALCYGMPTTAGATAAIGTTFDLTSCHISTGCPTAGTVFGTVTLTQNGTSVDFNVSLNSGSTFVETGAGGNEFFLFNDTLSGSTITNISGTVNGVVNTSLALTGFTNLSPVHADGTGDFTASVECVTQSDCNGGSPQPGGNLTDLHFTVTNATIAQLDSANSSGNIFVADILCGATVTGCAGNTGPVDVHTVAIPAPLAGAGLPGLIAGCLGLFGLARRRRRRQQVVA